MIFKCNCIVLHILMFSSLPLPLPPSLPPSLSLSIFVSVSLTHTDTHTPVGKLGQGDQGGASAHFSLLVPLNMIVCALKCEGSRISLWFINTCRGREGTLSSFSLSPSPSPSHPRCTQKNTMENRPESMTLPQNPKEHDILRLTSNSEAGNIVPPSPPLSTTQVKTSPAPETTHLCSSSQHPRPYPQEPRAPQRTSPP